MSKRGLILTALAVLSAASSIPETTAAEEGYVIRPNWLRRPSANDMRRLYPRTQRGVEAFVSLDCIVDEQGQLSTCEVVKETPAGMGFGESTIKLSKLFKMRLTDADGAPVAGRKQHLPVRWYAGFSR